MCGIVGAIAKLQRGFIKDDVSMFYQMLVTDSLRGADATGVWGVYPGGNVLWTKIGGAPHALFDTAEYANWEDKMQKRLTVAIGHNRFATSGGGKSDHAHPFVKDHIIMCHNGAIWNHAEIRPDAPADSVDSECIAHLLAREPDYVKAIESLEGAYAIVWYNAKEKKTYFVHNDERPLFYMECDHTIYLMSEKTALTFLRDRNGIDSKFNVLPVPEDRIFCWDHATLEMSSVPYKYHVAAKVVGYEDYFQVAAPLEHKKWPAIHVVKPTGYTYPNHGVAALEKSSRSDVFNRLIKAIPSGTEVVIAPTRVVPWDISQYEGRRLESETLHENHKVVYKYSGPNVEEIERLGEEKFIKGTVVSHLLAEDHFAIWLKNVRPSPATPVFKAFNGISVTFKEWSKIQREVGCRKCDGNLPAQGLKLTSLQYNKHKHKWTAVCPSCVVAGFKAAPEHAQTLMESKAGIDVKAKATALGVWGE